MVSGLCCKILQMAFSDSLIHPQNRAYNHYVENDMLMNRLLKAIGYWYGKLRINQRKLSDIVQRKMFIPGSANIHTATVTIKKYKARSIFTT